jgi:hypothetical protein
MNGITLFQGIHALHDANFAANLRVRKLLPSWCSLPRLTQLPNCGMIDLAKGRPDAMLDTTRLKAAPSAEQWAGGSSQLYMTPLTPQGRQALPVGLQPSGKMTLTDEESQPANILVDWAFAARMAAHFGEPVLDKWADGSLLRCRRTRQATPSDDTYEEDSDGLPPQKVGTKMWPDGSPRWKMSLWRSSRSWRTISPSNGVSEGPLE